MRITNGRALRGRARAAVRPAWLLALLLPLACGTPDDREAMWTALREAEYPVDAAGTTPVHLRGGAWEAEATPGSATRTHVSLIDVIALGDVNGDRHLDAAVPIRVDGGGSGSFVHLALALREGETVAPVATAFLGDRIAVDSLRIGGDSVIAFTREHAANQPMAGAPAVPRTRTFTWREGALREAP